MSMKLAKQTLNDIKIVDCGHSAGVLMKRGIRFDIHRDSYINTTSSVIGIKVTGSKFTSGGAAVEIVKSGLESYSDPQPLF